MRSRINIYAHKFLPEILFLFSLLVLTDIFFSASERGDIKNDTEKTLSNQFNSMSQDSLVNKSILNIEKNQKEFVNNAESLRIKIRK